MVKEKAEKQYKIFKDIQLVSAWCCMVVCSCVFALINDFIAVWIGDRFIIDNLTVIAVIVNFFLLCLLNPIWIFREAAGIYRKTKYIMVICAILNVFLSIALGKVMGLSGIIFASALSKLLTYIWYEPIILFKNFFKKSPMNFFMSSLIIILLTAGTSAMLFYIKDFITMEGTVGFILKGLLCFALSNIVFILAFCKNKYFQDVVNRVISLLKGFLKRSR